jgi:hypothetical protein
MGYLKHATSHKLDAAAFKTFIFQGKALFTLENKEKGTYITFKVQKLKRKRDQPEETRLFDVHVRALNDQYQGLKYIGRVDRKMKTFKPSGYVANDHVGIQTMNWLIRSWGNLERLEEGGKLGMYHQGICCKCGLPLTVPESIENGIGPQCKKYRESRSLKVLEELGILVPGLSYNEQVINAVDKRPDCFEKIYIPETVRRSNEWIKDLDLFSSYGLW